jgi:hypothetical protein
MVPPSSWTSRGYDARVRLSTCDGLAGGTSSIENQTGFPSAWAVATMTLLFGRL